MQFGAQNGQNTLLIMLKLMKVTFDFILKIMKKLLGGTTNAQYKAVISSILILAWGCLMGQEKRKRSRNSNLLSNCAVFQPRWKKPWKTAKQCFFQALFWWFFKVFSISVEKQRNLTTKLRSLSYFASLRPLTAPRVD